MSFGQPPYQNQPGYGPGPGYGSTPQQHGPGYGQPPTGQVGPPGPGQPGGQPNPYQQPPFQVPGQHALGQPGPGLTPQQGSWQRPVHQPSAEPSTPAAPKRLEHCLPVATTSDLPGRTITKSLGDVVGIHVRPKGMTDPRALVATRQDAVEKMVQMADLAGADAVVGVRFDTADLGPCLELVAYGTAVRLGPARANHDSAMLIDDDLDEEFSVEVADPEYDAQPPTELASPAGTAPPTSADSAPQVTPGQAPDSGGPDSDRDDPNQTRLVAPSGRPSWPFQPPSPTEQGWQQQ